MAETEAASEAGGSIMESLGKKVGPLPIGVWLIIAVGVFWYIKKKQGGSTTTGPQTDPAGNVGTIDPATGYVYGSSQDQSALGQSSAGTGTGSGSGTSGGSTVGGVYSDNTAWAQAAINYLVSIGVDAVSANSAITQYLASQALTTEQQADVNLAIQRIGSPPSPPQPGTAPPPVVSPPGPGKVYASNPPTGLALSAAATSIQVKWNRSSNAQGYTIKWNGGSTTVSGTAGSTTITGLKPNTRYTVQVQATPAKPSDAFASATTTTAKSSSGGGGGGGGGNKGGAPRSVRAQEGDSFSKIAQREHYAPGGFALYQFNLTTPFHSAQARKEIKDRGPNEVVANEEVFIP